MAIPGSKPKLDIHAKVRIGEQRVSERTGKSYPAATDYFLSDHPDFDVMTGGRPKELFIRLVHDSVEDAFSTGLEWWIKTKNGGSMLACYTKDGGENPVALRMADMLDEGQKPLSDEQTKGGRLRIACPARSCPHMKKKGSKPADCRPMGRLVFVLDGDPLSRVWELDTKAWSSVEALEGQLRLAQARGPLAGRLFALSVRMEKSGTDRFPVLSIREEADVPVQVNDEKGVTEAEAVVALAKAYEASEGDTDALRRALAAYLDATRMGWRVNAAFTDRIKEVGVEAAIQKILSDAA